MEQEPQKNIVQLDNIEKKFAGVYALKGVSFSMGEGQVSCLAGENGCGKSTLIKIISGFYRPDAGRILLNGYEYPNLHPYEAIVNGIQVIYQDFSLFPNLSVAENIAFNRYVYEKRKFIDHKEVSLIAEEGLARVGVHIKLDTPVGELSVADKQLVAISRALVTENSKLIIMDEPTTALTHHEISRLLKVILSLKEQKISTIFVSHKLRELLDISDNLMIMRNGEKVAEGPIREFNEQKISFFMTGREIKNEQYLPPRAESEPILTVDKLTCAPHFEDISFQLNKRDILGITGLLGCGRNEIAKALYGLMPVQKGTIKLYGKEIKSNSIKEARKAGIGYVPEDRLTEGLFLPQSILNNTIVSIYDRLANRFGVLNFKKAIQITSKKNEELKLNTADVQMPVQNLSGGNQQRVVIAKWLVSPDIKLMIFNGPSVGVDVGSKFEIHRKIQEIAAQGIGVIIISDDISELLQNCNRILMIRKGRLVDELTTANETADSLADALSKEY